MVGAQALVVADRDKGNAKRTQRGVEVLLHGRVDRRRALVHQRKGRAVEEQARHCQALLLTAAQVHDVCVRGVCQMAQAERVEERVQRLIAEMCLRRRQRISHLFADAALRHVRTLDEQNRARAKMSGRGGGTRLTPATMGVPSGNSGETDAPLCPSLA